MLTLAIGIGTTTATYSVAYAALFRPPAIAEFDRVVNLYHSNPKGPMQHAAFSWPDVMDIRASQTVFSDIMTWSFFSTGLSGPGGFEVARGELVSDNYFAFVGTQPLIGRTLQPGDENVAVISQAYWQRLFASDPEVIGQTLTMKGRPFVIAGVMPASFRGVDVPNILPTNIWVSIRLAPLLRAQAQRLALWSDRDARWVLLKARLRHGVTLAAARAQITTISERLNRSSPLAQGGNGPGLAPERRRRFVVSMASDVHAHESVDWIAVPLGKGLLVTVGLSLLVACTNLANLLIARGGRDRRELAVRRALGASRWQLIRALLLESLVLGVVGGAAGLLLAAWLMHFLSGSLTIGRGLSMALEPRLEPAVLGVALLSIVGSLLVFGLVPAWHTTKVSVRQMMDSGGGSVVPQWRVRRLLIVGQLVVSVALLAVGAVFARAALAAARHDPGFDLARLVAAHIDFAFDPNSAGREARQLESLVDKVRQESGVESASLLSRLPVYFGASDGYHVGAEPRVVADMSRTEIAHEVLNGLRGTAEMFGTLGIELIDGRPFTESEVATNAPVVVVGRSVALQVFGTTNVAGRTLFVGVVPHSIIGVAEDIDAGTVGTRDRGFIYLPFTAEAVRSAVVAARVSHNPARIIEQFRGSLRSVGAGVPVVETVTGPEIAAHQTRLNRMAADIAVLLGVFTLVLALVGLSGLLGYLVSSRRREIGVRMALGAKPGQVVRMILMDGLRPVLIGSAVGLLCGGLVALVISTLFLPRANLNVATVVLLPLVLLPAACLACYIPARLAARVDPSVALHDG